MSTLSHRGTALRAPVRRSFFGVVYSIYRQRQHLAKLDDRALRDIGVTRKQALTEANRPFWDIFGA